MRNKHYTINTLEIIEAGFTPILVDYEDLGDHQGRIRISHGNRSWSSFWNALGPQTVEQMFHTTDPRKLAKDFAKVDPTVYDPDATQVALKQVLFARRRRRELPKLDTRILYEASRNLLVPEQQDSALRAVYGPKWWDSLKRKPNPEFELLVQVIEVIQERRDLSGIKYTRTPEGVR